MELNISSMRVQDILKKQSFRRPRPLAFDSQNKGGSPDYDTNMAHNPVTYDYPVQDDFIREYYPQSHDINSVKYYPNLYFLDSQHKVQMKVRSRVSVALQQYIHTRRLIALTGYDPDITISSSNSDRSSQQYLKKFKEGWSVKGMDGAIHLAISADLKVGDVAICGYKASGEFGYRIFSYDRGDILYPHLDPMTGRVKVFGRKFKDDFVDGKGDTHHNIFFLDVWDDSHYIQFREAVDGENTESGWVVSQPATLHQYPFCPVAYHRYGMPCWSNSQSLIDMYELALSQLAENNAQYAMRILVTLGAEFEMQGSTDGTPTQINSTDPNAKAMFLEPADASGSFQLQLSTLYKDILRSSSVVEAPELKSGSDISSLTVKMLFADAYQQALKDAKEYQSFLDDVVRLFIEGYGTEEMLIPEFKTLHVTATLHPYIFQSETEVVNTLVQLSSVGVLSKRTSTEIAYEQLGMGAVDEYDRVQQEGHDEIVGSPSTKVVNVVNQARNKE